MGYFATGRGVIELTGTDKVQDVMKKLENTFEVYLDKKDEAEIEVVFSGSYHEEDIYELLNSISIDMDNGKIYFIGEDDSHWKAEFDPMEQNWKEYSGKVVYEDGDGE